MSSAWVSIILVVLILGMVPLGLKWLQRRVGAGAVGTQTESRVVSAVAVGPHQRVVTVEVGPQGARVWLTLGVTAQSIHCLHTVAAPDSVSAVTASAPGSQRDITLS